MKMIKPIVNLSKITDLYDSYVLGFNGVIYDGQNVYPEAAECLKKLSLLGKKIIIVSNTYKRVAEVASILQQGGINLRTLHNVITAGEVLHYKLKYGAAEYAAIGNEYYQIGSQKDNSVFSGLEFYSVPSIERAHFLYMSGVISPEELLDSYRPQLEQAVNFGLPFVCAGNDTSCFIDGKVALASGAFAEAYAILGGNIITLGKPDIKFMQYALEGMDENSRILVIGDNIATDIKSATIMEKDSMLISKGRHVNYLGEGYIPDVAKTRELSNSYDVSPSYVISALRW